MIRNPDNWRHLYPFQSHFLNLDGHRYHYLDEGQGQPLLLVHGNPTWSFYWRELILALRSEYRVLAVDHVGCGLSDQPRHYEYRLSRHIHNLRALIEHLDLRQITLVAHDWGGAIGLGAAGQLPDRFARLILLNTAAFPDSRIPWRIRLCRLPALGPLAVRGLNAFARAALWMAVSHRQRMTPAVRAGLLAPYDSWAARQAILRFVQDIPLRPRHPSYPDLCQVEAGLVRLAEKPCQLIWGLRDWCFTPWFLRRFQDYFPRAEVLPLADAGHYVVEDAHERIAPEIRRFLAAHPLDAPRQAAGV
jgi:haloalkane dehalogenase